MTSILFRVVGRKKHFLAKSKKTGVITLASYPLCLISVFYHHFRKTSAVLESDPVKEITLLHLDLKLVTR